MQTSSFYCFGSKRRFLNCPKKVYDEIVQMRYFGGLWFLYLLRIIWRGSYPDNWNWNKVEVKEDLNESSIWKVLFLIYLLDTRGEEQKENVFVHQTLEEFYESADKLFIDNNGHPSHKPSRIMSAPAAGRKTPTSHGKMDMNLKRGKSARLGRQLTGELREEWVDLLRSQKI